MTEDIKTELTAEELEDKVLLDKSEEDSAPVELEDDVPSEVSAVEKLRNEIAIRAGVVDSRQGKAWDLQEVLLVSIMETFTKLSKATSFADVQQSVNPQNAAFFEKILSDIQNGNLELTYTAKGLTEVDVVNETITTIQNLGQVFKDNK